MTALTILIIVFVALVLTLYILRKRFGLPTLGLLAGWAVANIWALPIAQWLQSAGVQSDALVVGLTSAIIIVVPALLLASVAQVNNSHIRRLIGAVIFGLMGMVLLLDTLQAILVIEDDTSQLIVSTLQEYRPLVIGIGALLALLDGIMTRSVKPSSKH